MGNCSRGEPASERISCTSGRSTSANTRRRRYRSFYLPTSPENINDAFAECFVGKQPALLQGGETLRNMATREVNSFVESDSFVSSRSGRSSRGSSLLTDSTDASSFDSAAQPDCRCCIKVGSEVRQSTCHQRETDPFPYLGNTDSQFQGEFGRCPRFCTSAHETPVN